MVEQLRSDSPVLVIGLGRFGAACAGELDRLDRDSTIRACVLRSGKPDGFVAGADIEQFAGLRDATDAEAVARIFAAKDRPRLNPLIGF